MKITTVSNDLFAEELLDYAWEVTASNHIGSTKTFTVKTGGGAKKGKKEGRKIGKLSNKPFSVRQLLAEKVTKQNSVFFSVVRDETQQFLILVIVTRTTGHFRVTFEGLMGIHLISPPVKDPPL